MTAWRVERVAGSAGELHARRLPEPLEPSVWVLEVERPALVLGSTQSDDVVDHDATTAAGVEVVRRRSGGGAVLLRPGEVTWVDVLVPTDHPRAEPDVGKAFAWLGRAWAAAVARSVLGARPEVHEGPLERTRWSGLVCFAGAGPGEVRLGGAKVVGMAQRRTKGGALFQCAALLEWRPARLLERLALTAEERARAAGELVGVARGLEVDPDGLVAALLDRLP